MTDRDELIEIMARAYAERNDFDWESPGHAQIYYLGHARAALAALREAGYEIAQGWRPIETAPRDGTEILLFDGGDVFEGRYNDRWYADASRPWWGAANLDEEYDAPVHPTHWMPLPAPPQKEQDGQG